MVEKGEIVAKKWVFRGQKLAIGIEKIWDVDQTRKAKWCKTQVLFLKEDKAKGVKD